MKNILLQLPLIKAIRVNFPAILLILSVVGFNILVFTLLNFIGWV